MSIFDALLKSGAIVLAAVAISFAFATWVRFCIYRINTEWLAFAASFAPFILIAWIALAISEALL